jgi:HEAT repeat protein
MAKAALKRAGEAAVICMLSYLPKGTREQRLITRDLIVNLGERGLDYVRIALKHRDWRVREMAVMALVQLPIAEDRRIAKLQQMLLDDDPFVRYEVIKGLGVFGERSKAVLARMVNLLQEGRAAPKPPPGPGGSLEDVHGPWGAWKPSEEDQTNIKIDDPERSLHSVMRDLRDKISDISDDIDRDVRRAVVQELAKIELDAAVVTRHLLAALKDRDQFVRKDAEHEIRQLSIRAVPTLIAEIQLPTSDQRFIAAELLGDIGQPALSEIAKLLTSLDQTVWRASLRALQRMGSQASALVPLLCNQLSMSSEIQARDLTETLSEIGISAFSCLRQLVAHPQSSFRSIALYGLSRMVSRHTKYANLPLITEIIVFLRRGLEDKDLTVQSEAIWGIGQIGQQIRCDNPLSPKSSGTSLPNSNPASTQGSAQTTACRYAQFTMDLLPSLLVHPCRNLTQCMSILFRTWVNIAPAHPQVIAQLQQLLDRGSDLQRIAVLRTLVQITPLDLALQELALSHFQSDNPKLRMAALDALSAHPHQLRSSLSSLQKLLFSDHVEVQITTVWLIARVGSQAKLGTALIEPLSRLLLHTTPRIQHAAIEALYHSQIRPNNKLQTILLQLLGTDVFSGITSHQSATRSTNQSSARSNLARAIACGGNTGQMAKTLLSRSTRYPSVVHGLFSGCCTGRKISLCANCA